MSLTDDQERDVDSRIQSFFNHYLLHTLPETLERTFDTHNRDCTAHGSVAKKFDRFKWAILGAMMAAFGGGVGVAKLLAVIP